MKTLLLLRHAKAGVGAPDRDRGLTGRGRRQSAAAGRYLAAEGLLPDFVICSDARRTRETLDGLALGEGPAVQFAPGLYDGHVPELLDLVRGIGDAGVSRVLVIGHNPTISDAGRWLAREGDPAALSRLGLGMPTSGLAVLKFEAADWRAVGAGALTRLLRPADYPGAD